MIGRGRQYFRRVARGDLWRERRIGATSTSLASAGGFDLSIAVRPDARTRTIVSWLVAIAVVTAIVGGLALLRVHAVDPDIRSALEVTIALSAIVTAWLLIANWRRSREVPDLLLLAGLLALSLTDFVFLGLPALEELSGVESSNGLLLGGDLVAALAIATASIAGLKSARLPRREPASIDLGAGAGLVVLGMLLAILIGASALHMGTGGAANDPVALSVHTISAAILLAAAVAFLAGFRSADGRTVLFAAACLLLAGANLCYLRAPAVRIDWVTPQDGLRLGTYALLLAGAYLQHAQLQRDAASAAIAFERERIARDLHDGLAQDLACIAFQGQRLDSQLGPEHPLMVATRHALAASRGVIADLTASAAPTTEAALRIIANELEHRYDLEVNVRVETDIALSPHDALESAQREDLIRIAREAIVNAAMHGTARHVDVVLLHGPGTLLMRVSDDGRGISDAQRFGFGLRSMRARAASLGGQLSARPRVGGGTDLELLVS
jgi:signal transduction histidine kinase